MNEIADISYQNLFAGYALFIIPFLFFSYFKTGLLKDSIIAVIRMTVQLLLVGFYLEILFDLNSPWLNTAWFIVMTLIATFTVIKRSELHYKIFLLPVFIGMLGSLAVSDAFFLGALLKLDNFFDSRYFIPLTGMLIGNSIKIIIVAMNSYYGNIQKEQNRYRWYLANGATKREALKPFMREAMKAAFNPLIATTAIMGLISLPGMMTGQILGGSTPGTAIRYQIMLMITLFTTAVLSVIVTILLSDRFVFDEFDNLRTKQA